MGEPPILNGHLRYFLQCHFGHFSENEWTDQIKETQTAVVLLEIGQNKEDLTLEVISYVIYETSLHLFVI